MENTVLVKLLDHYAGPRENLLSPAQPGDAGVDIYAAEDAVILPGERKLIRTGICLALPPGHEAQVRPRSGNALKLGLTVLNTPGTVDEGYRGEVGVIVYNANPVVTREFVTTLLNVLTGQEDADDLSDQFDEDSIANAIRIDRGQKIAQLVFAQYVRLKPEIVTELPVSVRGEGGFGSTGV